MILTELENNEGTNLVTLSEIYNMEATLMAFWQKNILVNFLVEPLLPASLELLDQTQLIIGSWAISSLELIVAGSE